MTLLSLNGTRHEVPADLNRLSLNDYIRLKTRFKASFRILFTVCAAVCCLMLLGSLFPTTSRSALFPGRERNWPAPRAVVELAPSRCTSSTPRQVSCGCALSCTHTGVTMIGVTSFEGKRLLQAVPIPAA